MVIHPTLNFIMYPNLARRANFHALVLGCGFFLVLFRVSPLWKGFITPQKVHAYLLGVPWRFVSTVKLFLTLRKLARTYK